MFGRLRRVARRTSRRVARRHGMTRDETAPPPEAPASEQAPTLAGESDIAALLQQLAALKEQGILTEEEFAAKKKQILGI